MGECVYVYVCVCVYVYAFEFLCMTIWGIHRCEKNYEEYDTFFI